MISFSVAKNRKVGMKSHSSVGIGGLSNKFKRYMRVDLNPIRSSIARAPTQILAHDYTERPRGMMQCNSFCPQVPLFTFRPLACSIANWPNKVSQVESVIFSDSTMAFVDFNDWRRTE